MKIVLRSIALAGVFILSFSGLPPVAGVKNVKRPVAKATAVSNEVAYLTVPSIKNEGWDTMPEVTFWQKIVSLDADSSVANVYASRKLLRTFPKKMIDSLERVGKLESLRAEVSKEYGLSKGERVMFTAGRKWFYNFSVVQSKIARALHIFDSLGVDPYYAQTVLLIESPGSNTLRSFAGAYGHFQIMPFNARKYGLRVDRYVDEREDFERSAYVSAMLFKETFIPYARLWCNQLGFKADENALWFKLLVMHCYNAGPYGVKSAMNRVPNYNQGSKLIHRLWHTTAPYFPGEAQNYSQLAVACYLAFEKELAANQSILIKQYSGNY